MTRQQLLSQQHHKRLARRIHDDVSQKMTLLTLQISLASSDEAPPEDWAAKCRDWAALVMDLGQTIRAITNELQPGVVDELGLCPALRWFAQNGAGAVNCKIIAPPEEIPLDPFAANEMAGICRELVTEFLEPGGVTAVELELTAKDGAVCLQLRTPGGAPGGGLLAEKALETLAARERMRCVEGTIELSETEAGAAVTLTVPAPVTSGSRDRHRRSSKPLPAA